MGIVFRQSIKGSLVIFTGAILGAVIMYLNTRVLDISLVGVSRNIINNGAVLQFFLLVGTSSFICAYLPRYRVDDPKRSTLITLCILVPLVNTLLLCIPYYLFHDFIVTRFKVHDRPLIERFYWCIPALGAVWSLITLFEMYLASLFRVAQSSFMREVLLRLCTLVAIGFLYLGWISPNQFVIATIVVHIVPMIMLFVLALKTDGFNLSLNLKLFSWTEIKEIIHYCWYHALLTVSLNLIFYLDALMLGMLSSNGVSDVAIYGFAQLLINILTIPYRAMSSASFPKMNQAYIAGKHNDVKSLFRRTSLNMLIVTIAMWVLIAGNLHNVVAFLPPQYSSFAPAMLILSLGRVVDISTGLNTELIGVTNYYRFNFWLSAGLLVSILILDRIFIPIYGLYGAAAVSSATLILFNIVKFEFLRRKTGIQPFSIASLKVIISGLIVYGIVWLLPHLGNIFVDSIVRSAAIAITFALALFVLRPSPDLSHYLAQVRKNKRLF